MSKIIIKSLLIASMSSIMFTGCWWNNETVAEKTYVNPELKGAPKWVMIPEVKGYVAELGSASKNAGNDYSFQREEAMADARSNIAKQISIKVNTMFKNFKSAIGAQGEATYDKATETVSKQISSEVLSGTKVKDTWLSSSGTL